jgi:hypothetical protein
VVQGLSLAPFRAHPPQHLPLPAVPGTWACARYLTAELQPATSYEARASYAATVTFLPSHPLPSRAQEGPREPVSALTLTPKLCVLSLK